MPDFEIVPYRPEFKEQVVALYSDAFQTAAAECTRYLEWKYERNPYLDDATLFLARDGRGVVVGMRGFYGTCWLVGEQRVVVPCADDFAIAAGARNQGLMTAIMRVAMASLSRRGFSHLLNASGSSLTVLQSLAMGWKNLGAMEPVARLGRWERFRRSLDRSMAGKRLVWRLAHNARQSDPACFARLDRSGRRSASPGGVVVEASPRAAAMAELAGRLPADGRIRHARDAAFFEWRFQNPTREYRFLYYDRGAALAGYVVLARYRSYRYPKLPFHIVDWAALADDVLAVVLEKALGWGRFTAIGTWIGSIPPGGREVLTRLGFTPTDLALRARGMPCVLLKRLAPQRAEAAAVDNATWDIRLIDSMHG